MMRINQIAMKEGFDTIDYQKLVSCFSNSFTTEDYHEQCKAFKTHNANSACWLKFAGLWGLPSGLQTSSFRTICWGGQVRLAVRMSDAFVDSKRNIRNTLKILQTCIRNTSEILENDLLRWAGQVGCQMGLLDSKRNIRNTHPLQATCYHTCFAWFSVWK